MAETLHRLDAWRGELDVAIGAVEKQHEQRLQCRRGCHQCCVDDITVFTVEAERIRRAHGDLLAHGTPHPPGACAFLDDEGACRIYEVRPYVCRTQGLPLRWFDEDEQGEMLELRDICPLNEVESEPLESLHPDSCWLIGPHEERLAEFQNQFDPEHPKERVALRSLFSPQVVRDARRRLKDPRRRMSIVQLALISEALLAGIAVVLGWIFGFWPWETLSWNLGDLFIGIAATVPLLGLLWVGEKIDWEPLNGLRDLAMKRIGPLFRDTSIWGLGIIALSAGVGEELLFRGALQAVIGDWAGPWIGLVVASVLFGLVHPISKLYVFAVFVVGMYLGAVWIWTDNLLVPIVVHALYDWIALFVLREAAYDMSLED